MAGKVAGPRPDRTVANGPDAAAGSICRYLESTDPMNGDRGRRSPAMVHIDPATLRRHPVLDVLIGVVAAAFLAFLLGSGWGEARVLLAQRAPDRVSIHEAVSPGWVRWVTLSEGQWHCERAITMERAPGLERWLRGPVESTEVPITGETEGELLVASFEGAVTCAERDGSSLTGVVGSMEIFTSRAALRRWGHEGERVAVLHVGATPRFALVMLVVLALIAALGIGFAGYYLRLMLRPGERRAAPLAAGAPIQPS